MGKLGEKIVKVLSGWGAMRKNKIGLESKKKP